MTQLVTQQELRRVRSIPFCCICGEPFTEEEKPTKQHTPPKAIFAECDRSPPLIVPAHAKCNMDQSPLDVQIGQLIAVLHGKYPKPSNQKINAEIVTVSGSQYPSVAIQGLPLGMMIYRWARCFHAALYNEFLPDNGGFVHVPFPIGRKISDGPVFNEMPICRPYMTYEIKKQHKAGRTDVIITNNLKCQYRCTWLHMDNGQPFCLFALKLYNWEELGDIHHHPRMGCIGYYFSPIPSGATRGTKVEIPASNLEQLDPFAP